MYTSAKRPLKVFLCHSSLDKPAVRKLYRYLKQRGVEPWLDELNLLPGQDWEVEIPSALFSSDVVLICLSKNSVDREGFINKEISFALDKALEKPDGTIFIVPVKLEDCKVPARLTRYHWVDLFREGGHKRLMQSLNLRAESLPFINKAEETDETPRDMKDPQLDEYRKNVEEDFVSLENPARKPASASLGEDTRSKSPDNAPQPPSEIKEPPLIPIVVAPKTQIKKSISKTSPRNTRRFGFVGVILIGLICGLLGGIYFFVQFLPTMFPPSAPTSIHTSLPSIAPTSIRTSPPALTSTTVVPLMSDDFSSPKWGTGTDADSSVEYANNALQMIVYKKNFFVWSTPPGDIVYQNVHAEVTVNNNGTDSTTAFGIMCNKQTSASNFYYVAITPAAQYAIAKAAEGQADLFLTNNDQWASSDLIAKDASSYHMGADCRNGTVTLYVDGQQIASVSDVSYTTGGVAVFAWSGEQATKTDISFDDFLMTQLP